MNHKKGNSKSIFIQVLIVLIGSLLIYYVLKNEPLSGSEQMLTFPKSLALTVFLRLVFLNVSSLKFNNDGNI